MRTLLLLAIVSFCLADWYNNQPVAYDTSYDHVGDPITYRMIDLDPDDAANQAGYVSVTVGAPFYTYGTGMANADLGYLYSGRRWRVNINPEWNAAYDALADKDTANLDARCVVCFDVKKEDGEIEDGTNGIGFCESELEETDGDFSLDLNFIGAIKATSGSKFKFVEEKNNHWDRDAGWTSFTSSSYDRDSMNFVSRPLTYGHGRGNKLGIKKGKTYWQCSLGWTEAPDPSDPWDSEIDMSDFTTDKARGIDTSCIEDFGKTLKTLSTLLLAFISISF